MYYKRQSDTETFEVCDLNAPFHEQKEILMNDVCSDQDMHIVELFSLWT